MELFDGSKWRVEAVAAADISRASRSAMPFRLRTAHGVHQTPLSLEAAQMRKCTLLSTSTS